MKTYRKKTIEVQRINDVLCDKCGKSIFLDEYTTEGSELFMSFGYGSDRDAQEYDIDLCDNCADWLLDVLNKKGK